MLLYTSGGTTANGIPQGDDPQVDKKRDIT